MTDTNAIIRAYLITCGTLTALIGGATPRIYCPRLPESATLPAVSFFTRGGTSTPYIPDIPSPSKQFDCWATNPTKARHIYTKLYDSLQGIQNIPVVIAADIIEDGLIIVPAGTYYILSAEEEVQGQDLQDEIPGYFRVLTFFKIKIRG
jgi:hypothetical protein